MFNLNIDEQVLNKANQVINGKSLKEMTSELVLDLIDFDYDSELYTSDIELSKLTATIENLNTVKKNLAEYGADICPLICPELNLDIDTKLSDVQASVENFIIEAGKKIWKFIQNTIAKITKAIKSFLTSDNKLLSVIEKMANTINNNLQFINIDKYNKGKVTIITFEEMKKYLEVLTKMKPQFDLNAKLINEAKTFQDVDDIKTQSTKIITTVGIFGYTIQTKGIDITGIKYDPKKSGAPIPKKTTAEKAGYPIGRFSDIQLLINKILVSCKEMIKNNPNFFKLYKRIYQYAKESNDFESGDVLAMLIKLQSALLKMYKDTIRNLGMQTIGLFKHTINCIDKNQQNKIQPQVKLLT